MKQYVAILFLAMLLLACNGDYKGDAVRMQLDQNMIKNTGGTTPSPIEQTHNVCVLDGTGVACQEVKGSGQDQCQNADECMSLLNKTYYNQMVVLRSETNGTIIGNEVVSKHKECKCTWVYGPGPDKCDSDSKCNCEGEEPGSNETENDVHSVCDGTQCITVMGSGVDECTSNTDCGSTQTHMECVGTSCTTVSGPGLSTCSNDLECQTGGSSGGSQNLDLNLG